MKKTSPKAMLPTRATNLSAGLDLYALETTVVHSEDNGLLRTGICVKVPPGTYGRIASRSGLSLNQHIQVGGGVSDEDYTGELKVIIFNHSKRAVEFPAGSKIAQLICEEIVIPSIEEVTELEMTSRGPKGFGSSDKHQTTARTIQ